MAFSDISRVQLSYIVEDPYGAQESGSPLQVLRLTAESLKKNTDITNSREIRSDRQLAAAIRTRTGVSGSLDFELSYGSFDVFMAAALMDSAWSTAETVISAGVVSAVVTLNKFTIGTSWTHAPTAGEWLEVRGFATAANNGYCKVVSATTTEIVVSGLTLANESDKAGVTIMQGAEIVNGVTKVSYNIERLYADLATNLALYTGCMMNQFSLTVGLNNIVTGNFGVMGQEEVSEAATLGSGYTAVNTNEILNSIDHVVGVYEAAASINVTDFTFTLNNNLREQMVLGTLGAISMGADQVNVSGSFTAYYESATMYDKYLNFTTTALAKIFEDTAGNALIVDFPEVKITDAHRHAGAGLGDDFKVPCTFQAFRHPTEAVTIRIVRFPA